MPGDSAKYLQDLTDGTIATTTAGAKRRRLLEAVTFQRALEYLDEHDYLEGDERSALFDDAEAEINAAVAAAAVPADPAERRRQREEREQ